MTQFSIARLKRPSRCRRALTLLEVLLATALLAMLAATCVPAIARAMAMLRDEPRREQQEFHLAHLAMVADAFLDDPSRFGVRDTLPHEIDAIEIGWPADSQVTSASSILVQAIQSLEAEPDHLWLHFKCDGLAISRWVAIPADPDAEPTGGSP
jgi:hypothetical protein